MAIIERTPADCYKRLHEHIGPLIAKTIPTQRPLLCMRVTDDDKRRTLEFAGGTPVELETAYGPLHFHLAQALGAEPEGKGWRLVTLKYWYRIQQDPEGHALLRWEYEKDTPRDRHARNHVQIRSEVPLADRSPLNLNKLHTPTGWTLIEEVIRFLIHDLGVKPPCGDSWHSLLSESEDLFYSRFATKGNRSEE